MKNALSPLGIGAILSVAALPGHAWAADAVQATATQSTDDHIVLGAGASVVPTFEGSDSTRVLPLPAIDIKKGLFVANMLDGVGVAWPTSGPISVGASVTFVRGYRRRDVPDGIDHVSNTAGGRVYVKIRQWGFVGTVGVTKPFGGAKGLTGDVLVSYPVRLSTRMAIIPSIGSTWANADYNRHYFGITSDESELSGLSAYRPGAGFKNVSMGLAFNYVISRHWVASAGGSVIRLTGDAADSPLVQDKTNGQGYAALSFRF